jgi:hypothetical protein
MTTGKMQLKPTIRKQRPDTVPYGENIARGPWVYAAYDGERRVCVAATATEAREAYHRVRLGDAYGRPPAPLRSELEGRRDRAQHLKPSDLDD